MRFAADQRGDGGHIAFIRNVHDVRAGVRLEYFAGEMSGPADTGRREIKLAGLRLRQRDQFPYGFHRDRRMHHEQERSAADQTDGIETLDRIVRHLSVKRGIDRQHAEVAQQQRVAVGRGLGDVSGTDIAARAAAIFDHDFLPPGFLVPLGNRAPEQIARSGGREWHNQMHRLSRKI